MISVLTAKPPAFTYFVMWSPFAYLFALPEKSYLLLTLLPSRIVLGSTPVPAPLWGVCGPPSE